MITKIGNFYNSIEKRIMMSILVIMVAVTFVNVVMRYIFDDALFWSEEFARYLFIWFSWIGVSVGLKDKAHLRVELLGKGLLRKGFIKTNEGVTIVVSLIWLATTIIVAYYGLQIIQMQMRLSVVTAAMRMPMWIVYLAIPFCSSIVGIRLIIDIAESIKVLLGKKQPDQLKDKEIPESGVSL